MAVRVFGLWWVLCLQVLSKCGILLVVLLGVEEEFLSARCGFSELCSVGSVASRIVVLKGVRKARGFPASGNFRFPWGWCLLCDGAGVAGDRPDRGDNPFIEVREATASRTSNAEKTDSQQGSCRWDD